MAGRYKAKCESCRYSKPFSDYPRSYVLDEGILVSVSTSFGCCSNCDDIEQIEVIPEIGGLEEARREIINQDEVVLAQYEEQSREATLSLETYLDQRLSGIDDLISWRRARKSPPRCLQCGSTSIRPLSHGKTNSGKPKWEGACLECDETIRVLREPAFVSPGQWGKYSPEGIHLEEMP